MGFNRKVRTVDSVTPGRKFSRLRGDNNLVKNILVQVGQRTEAAFIFSVDKSKIRAELESQSYTEGILSSLRQLSKQLLIPNMIAKFSCTFLLSIKQWTIRAYKREKQWQHYIRQNQKIMKTLPLVLHFPEGLRPSVIIIAGCDLFYLLSFLFLLYYI